MSIAFSVIVPAYNREDLIDATLAAIFAQSHPPAEVIVVDDGSTDSTAERARAWPGCTVVTVANGGAANARHLGVQSSKSSWIAFCDSDDLWKPDHLENIAAAVAVRPDLGFLFTNYINFRGETWKTTTKFDEAPQDFWMPFSPADANLRVSEGPIFEELLRFQPIFPSCTAMTRAYYDAVGGYDAAFGRLPSEDLEFTLRCVLSPPIGALLHPTAGIRRHEGNHSADDIKQLWGEVVILAHSRSAHAVSEAQRQAISRSIGERTAGAIDGAFARKQWALLRKLVPFLPRDRYSPRRLIKIALGLATGLFSR
jgi:glycosyltransferase involved in cell wall biosynthesis